MTRNLDAGVGKHIHGEGSKFVKKYKRFDLVFYKYFERITDAIDRKKLQNWHHDLKINLTRSINPEMKDLKGQLELPVTFRPDR